MRLGPEGQFGDFVEGLGPAQLVGRQVLGSPCLGEIQLGLFDRKGHLEVEVIRARGLMAKPGARVLPGTLRNYNICLFHLFLSTHACRFKMSVLKQNRLITKIFEIISDMSSLVF